VQYRSYLQAMQAAALLKMNSSNAALAVLRDAEERKQITGEASAFPEILRLKGLALAAQNDPDAEASLSEAVDLARRQEALFWELRASVSLAEFWRDSRRQSAIDLLDDVLARCSQGHAIRDRRLAETLRADLLG
jgi:hypothetical protein